MDARSRPAPESAIQDISYTPLSSCCAIIACWYDKTAGKPWDASGEANTKGPSRDCCTKLVKHVKAAMHLKNDWNGLAQATTACLNPSKMEVDHARSDRTSDADAFDNDDATTAATVALEAALEPADPPDAPPFGFVVGARFAAAADAFGAALGS